jgi:hypothetical protein
MLRPRSRAAIVATVLAAVLLAAPLTARADTTAAGAYNAKADATALDLIVFGQGLTLGLTHAENASDPRAAASGIGALVPGIGNQTEQKVEATTKQPLDQATQACGPVTLPPDFPVVDLATACSDATAAVNGILPSSNANASVANIDINGNQVLGPVASQVNQPIGDLLNGLQPVFQAVNQTGIDANSLLNQVVQAITQDGNLVRISLGPSHTDSNGTDALDTAAATAQGATIQVLPRDALGLEPVATIDVGASGNTINVDRAAGTASVAFDPALVRVTLAPDIAAALPSSLPNPIQVAPGQDFCLGLPAPLDSCITVAGGRSWTDENNVTHGEASAVSLHLLTGVQDGIRLDLAKTSVEGVGALDTSRAIGEVAAPAPVEGPPLARTGGTNQLPLVAVLVGAGMVGVTLSRTARRSREALR